jgi:integrase
VGLSVKRVEKLLSAGVPGRHTDGDVRGLMLCIESKTSAHWLIRWQRDGRVRHMGLGSASDLPLAAAREKARQQRERIARDIDPLDLKRAERIARKAAEAKAITFKQAAERYHEAHAAGWTSAVHAGEFLASLQRWAYKHIGDLDVAAIGKDEVLRVLEQKLPKGGGSFWIQRAITADRVRNRIERVLDFAAVRGFRTGDNPARWRGYLEEALPAPRKLAPVKHLHAVAYGDVPKVMTTLASDGSISAQALRFIVLVASRLSESVLATWDEIDLDGTKEWNDNELEDLKGPKWVIPKERMKSRRRFVVPLSPQAVELLRGLFREEGNPFVFLGRAPGTAVAKAAVMQALRRTGHTETVHGFRSSFSTWAHERSRFNNHVIELSLAHSVGTAVERSYRRSDLFDQRRRLAAAWSTFCSTPPLEKRKSDNKVVTMQGTPA